MWRGTLTAPTGCRQESVPGHKELHGGALDFVEGACAGTAVDRSRSCGRPHQHQYGRCVDAAAGIDERGAPQGPGDRRVPATTRTFPPGRGPGTGEGDRDSNGRTESTTDDGGGHDGAHGGTAQEGSVGTRTKALINRMGRDWHDAGHGGQAGCPATTTAARRRHAGMRRGRTGADPPGRWHPEKHTAECMEHGRHPDWAGCTGGRREADRDVTIARFAQGCAAGQFLLWTKKGDGPR